MSTPTRQLKSVDRPPAAGRGRKHGELNRTTVAVKEALSLAFDGIGGIPALVTWACEHPTEFYKLYVKLLPRNVTMEPDSNTIVRRALLTMSDDD